jgi:hypothetical protein
MSVGDSFTLVPLSNFFVKKSTSAGPDPNLGTIQPIASGNVTASNVTGGTYTWYQVFHFGGNANTQAFDNNFKVYKLFYNTMSTAHANYTASVNSTSTGIVVNFAVIGPDALTPIVNDGLMFLIWGI